MVAPKDAKKSKSKSGSKKAEKAAAAIAKLKGHAERADDPKAAKDALSAIAEIQKNYGKWNEWKATSKKKGFECSEKEKADSAALQAAIEEELPATSGAESAAKVRKKLENVERRWQELQETKAANIEERKHCKEQVKFYLDKFERSVGEASQLTLPHVGG